MADASAALGAAEVAGTFVSRKGLTKGVTATVAAGQVAGLVGSLVGDVATSRASQVPDLLDFGATGYLAASEQAIAVVKTKAGLMSPKVTDEALVSVPRTSVQSVSLDGGYVSKLKIEFTDGKVWEFEVPRIYKKTATQLVETLGGTVD